MIEEQYVSFETAKLLKEAGFDVPTRGTWRTNRTGDAVFVEHFYGQTRDDISRHYSDGFQHEYLAPTQSLAARWLREKYHIFLMITPMIDGWMYDLFDLDKHQYILCNADANTDDYESAFEAGLQEALRIIIKTKNNGQRKSS